jgi:CheY-like chemotaxis protein
MEGAQQVILLAEDDPNDVLLAQRACKKAGFTWRMHVCKDGEEAKEYLKGDGVYADRVAYPFPRMLVTDLKMPRCGGLELLEWLHANQSCNVVPLVVLSASPQAEDVKRAYQLGANCYLCKPAKFDRLVFLFTWLRSFCEEAMLPDLPRSCA